MLFFTMDIKNIPVGTMVKADQNICKYLEQIIPYGFECFSLSYSAGNFQDLPPEELAEKVMPLLEKEQKKVSTLSLYGNALEDSPEGEMTRKCIFHAINNIHLFHTDLFTCFTGAVNALPLQESLKKYKEVWQEISDYAGERGVRIAFENCPMGGSWWNCKYNIAVNPDAWELMYEALPAENIGLEWEPCHQMMQLIDPIPQIAVWGKYFFHIHGKDASVRQDLIARHGLNQSCMTVFPRTAGFGDSNWKNIISELRKIRYQGTIDIEGWHDPVYRDDLEMTGQVAALKYLKECRAGDYVPDVVL